MELQLCDTLAARVEDILAAMVGDTFLLIWLTMMTFTVSLLHNMFINEYSWHT